MDGDGLVVSVSVHVDAGNTDDVPYMAAREDLSLNGTERDRCMITNLVPLARPRVGLTLRSQDDRNPDFEPEVVGGKAGRFGGVEVFGRENVGLWLVSHLTSEGVHKLFSGKESNNIGIEGIQVSAPGDEDRALDHGSALGWQDR